MLKQISVFAENAKGQFHKMTSVLKDNNIRIQALASPLILFYFLFLNNNF